MADEKEATEPEEEEVAFNIPEMAQAMREQTRRATLDQLHLLRPPADAPVRKIESPLVAVYCLWKDEDWIEASLASVYPYVKKIVCLFNIHPWAGVGVYDDTMERLVSVFPDPDQKIIVERGNWDDTEWGGQLIQRTHGFDFCEDGDWYFLVDGDEVYWPESMEAIIGWCRSTSHSVGKVPCVSFFQDCYTLGWREHLTRLFRYSLRRRFILSNYVDQPHRSIDLSPAEVPIPQPFMHFGYVRSDARIEEKMKIYGQRSKRGDFYQDFDSQHWLDNVFYRHRKHPLLAQVHPLAEINPAYSSRVESYTGSFPKCMWTHPYTYNPGLVSIITVTYNSSEILPDLLASFREHPPGVPCEWIIVDNGSNSVHWLAIEKLNGQRLDLIYRNVLTFRHTIPFRVHRNKDNGYFTRALNQGIALARGEWLLSLNPDVRITTDNWLRRFIEDVQSIPGGAIGGNKQFYPYGAIQHAGGTYDSEGSPQHRGCDVHNKIGELDYGKFDRVEEVPWVTGSCMLIHRKVFIAQGYLDSILYPHYGSDRVYCEEARRHGFVVVYSPVPVIHLHGMSSEKE